MQKKSCKRPTENLDKKDSKPTTLKEDIEEAVKEAFADAPEEYC